MKKPYRLAGNIVEIQVPQLGFCYGLVLQSPLVGFFDILSKTPVDIEQLHGRALLFKIWVMKSAIGQKGWPVVGNIPLTDDQKQEPWFFKQDRISGKITKYRYPDEIPSSKEECEGLEAAAVWSREHVESRLVDHFEGRSNKWVESMALR